MVLKRWAALKTYSKAWISVIFLSQYFQKAEAFFFALRDMFAILILSLLSSNLNKLASCKHGSTIY